MKGEEVRPGRNSLIRQLHTCVVPVGVTMPGTISQTALTRGGESRSLELSLLDGEGILTRRIEAVDVGLLEPEPVRKVFSLHDMTWRNVRCSLCMAWHAGG